MIVIWISKYSEEDCFVEILYLTNQDFIVMKNTRSSTQSQLRLENYLVFSPCNFV